MLISFSVFCYGLSIAGNSYKIHKTGLQNGAGGLQFCKVGRSSGPYAGGAAPHDPKKEKPPKGSILRGLRPGEVEEHRCALAGL